MEYIFWALVYLKFLNDHFETKVAKPSENF